MKRLFAVFTLCATALIAAGAFAGPAAADGRHDGRRHAGQSDRQMSWYFTDRGRQHPKFRRQHKRHRHIHRDRRWPGYGYGRPRPRHGYRSGSAVAFNGARFFFRFD